MIRFMVPGLLVLAGFSACASSPNPKGDAAEPAVTAAVVEPATEGAPRETLSARDGGPEIISSQHTEEAWPPSFETAPYEEKLRAALKLPDYGPDEGPGVHVVQVRRLEGALLIEASMMGPGPCLTAFMGTFKEDGALISAWRVTQECDCPDACEGCERSESLEWRSESSFVVRVKEVDVLGEVTDHGECETKTRSSETLYEIQADGSIKKGASAPLPDEDGQAPSPPAPR